MQSRKSSIQKKSNLGKIGRVVLYREILNNRILKAESQRAPYSNSSKETSSGWVGSGPQ
jgi:hypothetical protein